MPPRRARALLLLLLAGQLFLLASQVPDPAHEGSALEGAALRLLGPPARLVARIGRGTESLSGRVRSYSALARENRELHQRVLDLEREQLRLRALAIDVDRLGRAVEYAAPRPAALRVADIVYADFGSWLRTVLLYTGERSARLNQPVVSEAGLVGRVVEVAGSYAKVQLINDRAASAAALLERTRRQGLLRGGTSGALEIEYVPRQADVAIGDRVVTAGIDGVYPRGIPIGVVATLEPGNELFWRIGVAPAVDFGALDQVYLVDREPVPEPLKKVQAHAAP